MTSFILFFKIEADADFGPVEELVVLPPTSDGNKKNQARKRTKDSHTHTVDTLLNFS